MQHSEVRIVKGVDDRLTGEAYVHISGARAKLRLALAKDRTLMPVCCNSCSTVMNNMHIPYMVCLSRPHTPPCTLTATVLECTFFQSPGSTHTITGMGIACYSVIPSTNVGVRDHGTLQSSTTCVSGG